MITVEFEIQLLLHDDKKWEQAGSHSRFYTRYNLELNMGFTLIITLGFTLELTLVYTLGFTLNVNTFNIFKQFFLKDSLTIFSKKSVTYFRMFLYKS